LKEDHAVFGAQAFNLKLGDEPVDGRITFERTRLQFFSDNLHMEIPLGRLDIQKDATNEARICFSTAEQPDWLICTYDSTVLQHAFLRQQPYTRDQIRAFEAGGDFKRRIKLTLGVLGSFAVLALLVSTLSGIGVRAILQKIPPEWEQKVGDDLIAELKQDETFVYEPKLLAKLDRAVAPLLKSNVSSPVQYKFYILQDPLPNAFALPGGHVVITTRLLELAERPEEIAGVIAHEIAHVTQKHGFRKIIAAAGPYLIFRVFLGNSAGILPILGQSSELLVRQSFSQEYELEADEVGWESLVVAHVDPRGLASMLRKLQAEYQGMIDATPQLNAFSSHPAMKKRVQRLDKKWEKLANKSEFRPL
jgi:beta-barrel assembly-enhancing protease